MAQLVKNLPAMWEIWVWSLGWEDPLEKGKATHSNILAWRIPWTMGCKESDRTESLSLSLWASLIAQLVKNLPCFNSWVRRIPWRSDRLPIPVFLGFPCGSAGKESACNAGHLGLIPGLGRSPGEGKVYPLQYSGLEKSMDCIVHGVTKSWTWLSGLSLYFTLDT